MPLPTAQVDGDGRVYLIKNLLVTLTTAPDLPTAIKGMLEEVGEASGWDYAEARLPDPFGERLQLGPIWMRNGRKWRSPDAAGAELSPGPVSLPNRLPHTNRPVWITDIHETSPPHSDPEAARTALTSAVVWPIQLDRDKFVVLTFYSAQRRDEEEDLLAFYSDLGSALGQALQAKRGADARSHLAALVNSSHDAILSKTLDGVITSWNGAAERMYGYSAEEVVGRHVSLLSPPESPDEIPRILEKLRKGEAIDDYETVRLRKNGSRIHVSLTISPVFRVDGKIIGASVIARNLTERNRIQRSLSESEVRFNTLADAVPVMMWMSGIDKRCTWFNRGWLEFTGRRLEQEEGDGWAEGVHPDDLARCLSVYNEAFDRREPFEMEYRLRRADGTYRWVLDRGLPRFATDGEFTGYIGGCVDITAGKVADQHVRDREERLRALFDTVVDGIITIDEHGVIESLNPAAERLFGYPAKALHGRNVSVLMPQPYRAEHAGYLARYLTTGEARVIGIGREVVGRRCDGSTFPMELAVSEMRVNGQRRFTGIVRDISERKRHERMIRGHEQDMEDFISIVTHDLKHPLVAIKWTLGLLQEECAGKLDANDHENLQRALAECDWMSELLDQLARVGRIGHSEIRMETVAPDSLIQSVVRRAQSTMDEFGANVEIHAPPGEVRLPRQQVAEALFNLVDNALRYGCAGESKKVRITCRVEDATLSIVVQDEGPGIDPSFHRQVFEPFRRLQAAVSPSGSGIGLAAVKRLMKRIGGGVALESESGAGAAFTLTVPLHECEDNTNAREAPSE